VLVICPCIADKLEAAHSFVQQGLQHLAVPCQVRLGLRHPGVFGLHRLADAVELLRRLSSLVRDLPTYLLGFLLGGLADSSEVGSQLRPHTLGPRLKVRHLLDQRHCLRR
jgi:hypothetical protein